MDLEEFELELELEGKSSRTIEIYSYYVEKFLGFIKDGDIDEVTSKDVKKFLIDLKNKDYSKKSMHLVVQSLRSYFREMDRKDLLTEIEPPKVPKSLPKALSEKELAQFLEAIPEIRKKDRAIIRLFYTTGLRVSEVSNLNVSNVNFEERLIRVEEGKGEKDRVVPVNEDTIKMLKEYLDREEGPLFLGKDEKRITPEKIRYIFKKYSEKSGIKCTPHTLRHTFATHMLEQGTDVRVIQNILGHASLDTTQIYTKVSGKHLKDSYDKVDLFEN